MIKLIGLFIITAGVLTDTPKPPTLTDAQQNDFHTAQALMISSNAQAEHWHRVAQDDSDAFHKLADPMCGEGFTWQTDEKDKVSCIPLPPKPHGPIRAAPSKP